MRFTLKALALVLLFTFSLPAHAAYIEEGKCYPASNFYYFITKKLGKNLYELQSNMVMPDFQHALYKSSIPYSGLGRIGQGGAKVKLTGSKDVELENGFSQRLPVFEDCKE